MDWEREFAAFLIAELEGKPPPAAVVAVSLPADDPDESEIVTLPVEDENDLPEGYGAAEGQYFMIEYRDSKGEESRRRVTIHTIKAAPDGSPILAGICHERKAYRMFRADRILACIDLDGVVHDDVPLFLHETFGLPMQTMRRMPKMSKLERAALAEAVRLAKAERKRAVGVARAAREEAAALARVAQAEAARLAKAERDAAIPSRAWMPLRNAVKPHATLLVALSQSDGAMSEAETAIAERHCLAVADDAGFDLTADEHRRLVDYIRRLRPSASTIRESSELMFASDKEVVRQFLETAMELVDSDGQRHPAEVKLLDRIARDLTGTQLFGRNHETPP